MTPTIWLLGLSGSGKTTLGSLLRLYLDGQGFDVEFIDADTFCRSNGLSAATPEDRVRNTDALRDYALSLQAQGKVCVVAAATPYESMAVIVPHDVTARIQEAHIFILHHWADVLERAVAQK